jgi:hypothetical protein
VTDIKDIDGIFADGEDDAVLVNPLAPSAVDELTESLRELVTLCGERWGRVCGVSMAL